MALLTADDDRALYNTGPHERASPDIECMRISVVEAITVACGKVAVSHVLSLAIRTKIE